jgi:hypothetical protein
MVLKVKNSASPEKRASAAAKPASRVAKPAGAVVAASAAPAGRIHNAAPPAANGLSPELEGVFDLMLADIDHRLAKIGRDTDELLALYNLA